MQQNGRRPSGVALEVALEKDQGRGDQGRGDQGRGGRPPKRPPPKRPPSKERPTKKRRRKGRRRKRPPIPEKDVNFDRLNHKNIGILVTYLSDHGKILPRRRSGLSSKHQKKVTTLVKTSRIVALLPFVIAK
jgi:small subunit ribosomal protein S18